MPLAWRRPIGPDNVVSVQGRYLVTTHNNNSQRFLMQGMAFPIAPRATTLHGNNYDADGWIAVLEQLANDTDINTVRLYEFNCTLAPQYDSFLHTAADLGIYVVIPLTTVSGKGVLARDVAAPHCYNRTLYEYGTQCMHVMARYPNILAGMIGNEVMNALETWPAAPCIKAYARDLKRYAATLDTSARTEFPFMYAAQHDSPTAGVLPDTAMKLTMDYLACQETPENEDLYIDVFGINVESWCSSLQTFEYNEDGITESAYHVLWSTLHEAAPVPLVFSEMGCSKLLFNRDNGLTRYQRDWKQVPVVLQDMVDIWSGFCAYTYDGNVLFRIMDGNASHWNGHDILPSSIDYENFAQQLHQYHEKNIVLPVPTDVNATTSRPLCENVRNDIRQMWQVNLRPLDKMPSYYNTQSSFWDTMNLAWQAPWTMAVIAAAMLACLVFLCRKNGHKKGLMEEDTNKEASETDKLLPKA